MLVCCPECESTIEFIEAELPSRLNCVSCGTWFVPHLEPTVTFVAENNCDTVSYGKSGGQKADSVDPLSFFGDYQIIEELARGGMGVVYKAQQLSLNRITALKMIKSGELSSDEEVQRFRAEAESAAQLDHPNIVPIYEVGEENGEHFFSMGFVEGSSLKQRVRDEPLSPREAARTLQKVAEAIAYAHRKGIVHRDLKPANILLDANNEPRVSDFGLAKRLGSESDLTTTGQILGTPAYMSPEQAKGELESVGELSDVYSLGATLYCLLTGRPPFQAATTIEVIRHVVEHEPVALRSLNASVPRDLETICLKCLRKEPHQRYQSAIALSDELQRFLAGKPILARPVSRAEGVWRWCRRKPGLAVAISAALLGAMSAVIVFAVAFVLVSQSRDEAVSNSDANKRLADENNQLFETERKLRIEARRDAARSSFERSFAHIDGGEIARGVVRLSHALARAEEAEDFLLAESIRRLLAAWIPHADQPIVVKETNLPGITRTIGPKGKKIVLSRGNQLILYNRQTGRGISLTHPTSWRDTVFQKDGSTFLTIGSDHHVRQWNADTGKPAGPDLVHEEYVLEAEYSADGAWIATTSRVKLPKGQVRNGSGDFKLCLWESKTGIRKRTFRSGNSHALRYIAWHPKHVTIAVTSANRIRLISTDEPFRDIVATGWRFVSKIEYSPNGEFLLTANENEFRLWDVESRQQVGKTIKLDRKISRVKYSPNGEIIAACGHDWMQFWDANTLRALGPPMMLDVPTSFGSFNFSPQNDVVIMGHMDRTLVERRLPIPSQRANSSTVRLLDTIGVQRVRFIGQNLVTVSHKEFRTWDTSTCLEVGTASDLPSQNTFVVGPKGKWVAYRSGQSGVGIWNSQTKQLTDSSKPLHKAISGPLEFSPDGQMLASVAGNGPVQLVDPSTGTAITPPIQDGERIFSLAFSPDGTILATGGLTSARLWSTATGKPVSPKLSHQQSLDTNQRPPYVRSVSFSSDGRRLLTACKDGSVRQWNVETGERLPGAMRLPGEVFSAVYDPSGTRILTVCEDWTAQFWNASDAKPLGPPLRHGGRIRRAIFSPDGKTAASQAEDGVRLWDVATSKPLGPVIEAGVPGGPLAFSPDSRLLATSADRGKVRLISLPQPRNDNVQTIILGTELSTGLEVTPFNQIRTLQYEDLRERAKRIVTGPAIDVSP